MIGNLAPLGVSLSDAKTWSLWEYHAVIAGWNAAHADEGPQMMDDEELDANIALLRAAKANPEMWN